MSSHNDSFISSGSSPTLDFLCEHHGGIFLLRPLTPSAVSWVEEHIGQENGYQTSFPTVVVENRFIFPILDAIKRNRLVVQP